MILFDIVSRIFKCTKKFLFIQVTSDAKRDKENANDRTLVFVGLTNRRVTDHNHDVSILCASFNNKQAWNF